MLDMEVESLLADLDEAIARMTPEELEAEAQNDARLTLTSELEAELTAALAEGEGDIKNTGLPSSEESAGEGDASLTIMAFPERPNGALFPPCASVPICEERIPHAHERKKGMPEQNQQAVPLSEEDAERAAALFKEIRSKTEELSLIVARTLGFEQKAAVEGRWTSSSGNAEGVIVPLSGGGGGYTECYTFPGGGCGCYVYDVGYCFPC